MKKATFLFILLFTSVLIKAQDYQISFTGSGQSTTVDSVFVENLTQDTTLALAGSDVLHLVGTVGISSQSNTNENLNIYPNPMQQTSRIEFHSEKPDNVKIEIFDLSGKLIVSHSAVVRTGINVFDISGFPEGFYTISISTSEWQQSSGFVSVSDASKSPLIKTGSKTMVEPKTKTALKSTKSLVQMQYNDGDNLLFKGVSGDYARVV
ncbi:MAG: T9SS type A sorting domain-containing protein [Bacteroidales bacterium]